MGMVILLILIVYSVTSTINLVADNDPAVCNDTSFTIKNVCFNDERTSLNNFHTSINIDVQNSETEINGFTVLIYGEKNTQSSVIFKTVPSMEQKQISVDYEKDIAGDIEKIEIKPMLNINQDIYHCTLRHGVVYDGEIPVC